MSKCPIAVGRVGSSKCSPTQSPKTKHLNQMAYFLRVGAGEVGSTIFDSITELIKAYAIEVKLGNKTEVRSNNHIAIDFGSGDLKK